MSFFCPDCRHRIKAPHSEKTNDVVCPECGHKFTIPDEHRKGVLRPGTRVGGYEIIRLIGSGGMGKVYEATQLSLNRPVALKVLSPKVAGTDAMVKRFLLEVRATASLEHVNIVTVYEANEHNGMLFLAMELIHGMSVDKILTETKQPIDEKDALTYASKVAQAMHYAWRHQKLLHRDIKPANIIIEDAGDIKLCDLGIAKRPNDEFDITQEGMAIGTPHYMSPEQGQGLLDIDFRSDIYSLGASLFHMATGTLPFDDKSAVSVITKQIVEKLPDPKERNPKLSDPCCQLIRLMMAKRPEQRHKSWTELITDIERVIDGKYPVFRPLEDDKTEHSPDTDTEIDARKIARTTKQTMVDMQASEQDLRRVELEHRRQSRSWAMVRAAILLLVLTLLLGTTAYQFRASLMPGLFSNRSKKVRQILQLDDGTTSAPPAKPPQRPVPEEESFLVQLIEETKKGDLDTKSGCEEMLEILHVHGLSPTYVASAWRDGGRHELAEKLLHHCLNQTKNPKWAAAAGRDLAMFYRETRKDSRLLEVLRKSTKLADIGQTEAAAVAYLEMTDYYIEKKQERKGLAVLQEGIRRYAKDKPDLANVLATRLLRGFQARRNKAALWKWTKIIMDRLPKDSPAHRLAGEIRSKLPALPDARLPIPETDQEARYLLRPQLKLLADARTPAQRANALAQIAAHYRSTGNTQKAKAYYSLLAGRYGKVEDGRVGGQALINLARLAAESGEPSHAIPILNKVLELRYYGPDDEIGATAAMILEDIYRKTGRTEDANTMQQQIVHAFPGLKGENAGKILLAEVEKNIQAKRIDDAYRQLQKIAADFPGPNNLNKKKAQAKLKELKTKHAAEVAAAAAQAELFGPFVRFIPFGKDDIQSVARKQPSTRLGSIAELTLECWLRVDPKAGGPVVLMSRHNGKKSGFTIILEQGNLVFRYSDGHNDGAMIVEELDLTYWRHLAIVAGKNSIRVYLDGRQIAKKDVRANIAHKHAGAFRIGNLKDGLMQFQGAMQHVIVFPGEFYHTDFLPRPIAHDQRRAIISISATELGVIDLCGGELTTK